MLRAGGRIAFTDWIAHQPLSAADKQLLWDGMAAATLISIDQHAELLRGAGFEIESIEDETDKWGILLAERLRMYQKLRGEAEQAGARPATTTSTNPTCCSSASCNERSWVARDFPQSSPPDAFKGNSARLVPIGETVNERFARSRHTPAVGM